MGIMPIDERITRLERDNRFLKRVAAAAAAVLACVLFMGQGVQGERLELRGEGWRILLGADAGGTPRLLIVDGKKRVRLDAGGLDHHAGVDPALLARARKECKKFYDAVRIYEMTTKKRPAELADLGKPLPGTENPLMIVHADPWDAPYVLEYRGEKPRIRCAGPDGEPGTKDDIVYGVEGRGDSG
jgi:hypothetical protein